MATLFSRSVLLLNADGSHRLVIRLFVAIAILSLWFCWFFLAQLPIFAVTESAFLEVTDSSRPIQAPLSGRVVMSDLDLGRNVNVGDVLLEFDTDQERAQLRVEQSRLPGLIQQVQAIENRVGAEKDAGEQDRRASLAQIEETQARRREAEEAASLAMEEAGRFQQLVDAGLSPVVLLRRAQAEERERRAAAESFKGAITRQEEQLLSKESERRARINELDQESRRIQSEISIASAEMARIRQEIDRRTIRSLISGKLGEVANIKQGSVLQAGERIAAIVPKGKVRVSANFQPAAALGRIKAGQRASVRLTGFPWTEYGSIPVIVTRVATEIRDHSIRVELDVSPDLISRIPIEHGLPGSVEIEVEKISPARLVFRTAGGLLAAPRDRFASAEPSRDP
jgi:multidrug resistance efflux pump